MNAPVSKPTFSALIGLLAEQAMLNLGVPHPLMDGPIQADPVMARFFIDLLAMLQDRMSTNLTNEERRALEDTLFQLRMHSLQAPSKEVVGAGREG